MTDRPEPSPDALEALPNGLVDMLKLMSLEHRHGPLVDEIRAFADRAAERARREAIEECVQIVQKYANSAAESAQVATEAALSEAKAADVQDQPDVHARWRQRQHYWHGKRHCAVEIMAKFRALTDKPTAEKS